MYLNTSLEDRYDVIRGTGKVLENRMLYDVKSDGNCLYRSLSLSIKGDEDKYQEIKDLIFTSYQKLDESLRKYIREKLGCTSDNQFLIAYKPDGEWGSDRLCQILAPAISEHIYFYIVQPQGFKIYHYLPNGDFKFYVNTYPAHISEGSICIYFEKSHYRPMVLRKNNGS